MSDYAEFHDELRSVARDLLAPVSPLVAGGDPVAVDWRRAADAGWPGLEIPDELGGAGASFAEAAIVIEELGRAAATGPFLGTVLAVGALRLAAPCPGRDDLLRGLAAGDLVATVAVPTGDVGGVAGIPGFRVEHDGVDAGTVLLSGRAGFVPDAAGADHLLVLATNGSGGTVLADVTRDVVAGKGVEVRDTPVVDPTRSFAEIAADGTPIARSRCWPLTGDPRDVFARGALAVALDSLGLARAALDTTVGYVQARRQFDRPIGSFQAVKHRCADLAVELTISRRLVADAVDRFVARAPGSEASGAASGDDHDSDDVAAAVSMAKSHAVETAVAATGTALQLHGGIGYTWEHGLHAYLKRAALNRSLFGSPAAHRARLAARYVDAAP